ncbi:unnamed protein product [Musa hybrid cultivar]
MMKKIILLQTWYFSCLSCACYPSFSLLKFSMGRLDVVIICLKLSDKKKPCITGNACFFFFSLTGREHCRKNGAAMPLGSLPNMFLVVTSQSPTEVHELKSAGYVDSILKPLCPGIIAACLWKALGMEHKRQQFKGQSMPLQSLLSGKNILVVDDNAINCKVAAAVLEKYGATVTSADSGKEAIKMLQPPHNFDACFMDVKMPEMDGFEATRQIRLMENIVNELIRSGGCITGIIWQCSSLAHTYTSYYSRRYSSNT